MIPLARAFALLACAGAAAAAGGEAGACAVLEARFTARQAETRPETLDTGRIQAALNLCNPGMAVVFESKGEENAFVSGPLIVPRGVTLWIAGGITLYASSNPRDYDLRPGSCGAPRAGPAEGAPAACKPFLYSYQAAFSGVAGAGAIDGQGQAWWKMAPTAVAPDLVSSYESQGFHVEGVALRNAAGMHLAIFKTTGPRVSGVRIESPADSRASTGILLSNTVDARISKAWIRVPAEALALKASILGGTSGVTVEGLHILGGRGIAIGDDIYGSVRDVSFEGVEVDGASTAAAFNLRGSEGGQARQIHFRGMCLRDVAEPLRVTGGQGPQLPAGRDLVWETGACPAREAGATNSPFGAPPRLAGMAHTGKESSLVVAHAGASLRTIQGALDALPATGGDITVKPGIYREVVTIRKPHVRLHGERDPAATVIVFDHGPSYGGTFASATVFVEADDVKIDHLTISNDLGAGKGQGVALAVTADRAIFRNLRLLGAQDTLFAASRYCYGDYGPCVAARQYFADSYIEGNTDFIFGDSMAVFERCELHGVATGSVLYTAQSRHTSAQRESGYVFDHCRLTGAPRDASISLGRPWRPYATVVLLEAQIEAPVIPAGWTEWPRFGRLSLPTAYYAEYRSSGPGANAAAREPYAHQLTAGEVEKWKAKRFLAGADGFHPAGK